MACLVVIVMYCGVLNLTLSFLLWQMWSVDYVQVPKEDKLGISHDESEDNGEAAGLPSETVASSPPGRDTVTIKVSDADSAQRVANLVKQMSLSAEFGTNDSGMTYYVFRDTANRKSMSFNAVLRHVPVVCYPYNFT